ncbi:MAG: hypothetical protein QNK20_10680 [Aureibaculum sp.]|nr:hypothetical protein [Aureibaculum sp.]
MLKNFLLITFILFQTNCFGQIEKSDNKKFIPFGPIIETYPRFSEDINLTREQNKKSFQKRIGDLIMDHLSYRGSPFMNDSVKIKAYIKFEIDTLGQAKFLNIKPEKIVSKKTIEHITTMIDSLPDFVPGKQRNKPVKVIFTLPIYSKNYFSNKPKKTSKN